MSSQHPPCGALSLQPPLRRQSPRWPKLLSARWESRHSPSQLRQATHASFRPDVNWAAQSSESNEIMGLSAYPRVSAKRRVGKDFPLLGKLVLHESPGRPADRGPRGGRGPSPVHVPAALCRPSQDSRRNYVLLFTPCASSVSAGRRSWRYSQVLKRLRCIQQQQLAVHPTLHVRRQPPRPGSELDLNPVRAGFPAVRPRNFFEDSCGRVLTGFQWQIVRSRSRCDRATSRASGARVRGLLGNLDFGEVE